MRCGFAPISRSSSRRSTASRSRYLDSAASSQKPRQVLDAMTAFYETSYANVHRGVYSSASGRPRPRERAREGARVHQRAERARDDLRPQRDRGRSTSSPTPTGSTTSDRATSCSRPSSSTTRTSCPGRRSLAAPARSSRIIPVDDAGELELTALERYDRAASRSSRSAWSRTPRHDQRRRDARRVGARARRDLRRRRSAGRAPSRARRAGARRRLRRGLRPQDVRPERDRLSLGPQPSCCARCRRSSTADT